MPVLMMEKFTGANMANKTLAVSGIQRIKLKGSFIYYVALVGGTVC